jgi:putative flavoprotein involved in K+ transport
MIDEFIISNKLDIPQEDLPELRDGYAQPIVEELDLKSEGISTIIWAGGYKFDYNIIKLPVCDPDGFPVQQRGVTNYPGLYFVGMPWMPSQKSGVLIGVAEAAKYIVSKIAETR